jgi:Cu+-exporting ATPase
MITGDNATTAAAVSASVGIPLSHMFAGMSPEGKEAKMRELKEERRAKTTGDEGEGGAVKKHGKVAFLGDGTNDSIALASADVGIAMASGTDIAVGAGDLVLCTNNLCAIITAIDLSKTTMRRIYLNYFWALIYNIILMPISAGVLVPANFKLSPMASGGAMTLSSLSIVVSSLLLALYKPPLQHMEDEKEKS